MWQYCPIILLSSSPLHLDCISGLFFIRKHDGVFVMPILENWEDVKARSMLAPPFSPCVLYMTMGNEDWIWRPNDFLHHQLLSYNFISIVHVEHRMVWHQPGVRVGTFWAIEDGKGAWRLAFHRLKVVSNLSINILCIQKNDYPISWHPNTMQLLLVEVKQRYTLSISYLQFSTCRTEDSSVIILDQVEHQQLVSSWNFTDNGGSQPLLFCFWFLSDQWIPRVVPTQVWGRPPQHLWSERNIINISMTHDWPFPSSQLRKARQLDEGKRVVGEQLVGLVALPYDVTFGWNGERKTKSLPDFVHNQTHPSFRSFPEVSQVRQALPRPQRTKTFRKRTLHQTHERRPLRSSWYKRGLHAEQAALVVFTVELVVMQTRCEGIFSLALNRWNRLHNMLFCREAVSRKDSGSFVVDVPLLLSSVYCQHVNDSQLNFDLLAEKYLELTTSKTKGWSSRSSDGACLTVLSSIFLFQRD